MKTLLSLVVLLLLTSLGPMGSSLSAADPRPKPNVVLILTDDLGWQDVKCYDIDEPSPTETPHLDAFAKRGVMFWQAYSPAPTCAPSRCAIMSGNHPARAQKTHVVGGAPPMARNKHTRMMDPWYSGRMPADEMTLAKALGHNGYTTGHVGKWHIAIDHHAFPQPMDVGFDFTRSDRGAHSAPKDRLDGFATDDANDPYRLDKDGFPYHQNNEDALDFLRQNKDEPFFLYYATWLVHSPIHTRSKALLDKYVQKLGVDPRRTNTKEVPGQLNPFYCAMVEMLDHYVGQVIDYMDETDDPRWPGHKLSENTYVIFTSDNGGMEGGPDERYTDNNPLDRGKISAKEGGTRVPLFIVGPGIKQGVQSNVMVNGLDFYPTILSLTGSESPTGKHLDGCDLSPLLLNEPTDGGLVKFADGSVRDTMMWHFPHGVALESTIRTGDYKLIRNYDHVNTETPELELFRLYDSSGGTPQRVDIEEAINLASDLPEKAATMNRQLSDMLTEMNASYPSYNPNCADDLPGKESVCSVLSHVKTGNTVEFAFRENGAKIVRSDLIYTTNGNQKHEEWFHAPATLTDNMKVTVDLPGGTTHYLLNLIDENNFLRSYPEAGKAKGGFANQAISVADDNGEPKKKPNAKQATSFVEKDANKDQQITHAEYIGHFAEGFAKKDKNGDDVLTPDEHSHASFAGADQDKNGKLTREEFHSIFDRQFRNIDKDGDGAITAGEWNR
ncbi:Arylsulfatase [Rubripirellula tenax]|uniref:Arylsulfatase n=1 Tax=Rubripirellula tenax TaxID=2528015 RepID=A0A5C6EK33_9BACT|nr:sulfatase-like hydrolase/transferase [Rubripirellula tenax]TWU47639.1 Arylsulfatase [Rubripirellula tenax]